MCAKRGNGDDNLQIELTRTYPPELEYPGMSCPPWFGLSPLHTYTVDHELVNEEDREIDVPVLLSRYRSD